MSIQHAAWWRSWVLCVCEGLLNQLTGCVLAKNFLLQIIWMSCGGEISECSVMLCPVKIAHQEWSKYSSIRCYFYNWVQENAHDCTVELKPFIHSDSPPQIRYMSAVHRALKIITLIESNNAFSALFIREKLRMAHRTTPATAWERIAQHNPYINRKWKLGT